jgi:stearoyl-CoA desaturase (Delta-9 desaturase)
MGWLLCKKHTDVKKFGVKVDMSDLESDPDIMFQHRNYMKLVWIVSAIIPTIIIWQGFGETLMTSFFLNVFRYIISLHITWLINSAAHMFGTKPFDK